MKKQTPEGNLKSAVEDLLKVEGILFFRMNAGDRFGSTNGRRWRIRGHAKGTADILAAPQIWMNVNDGEYFKEYPAFLWLELKAPKGKPTPEQLDFADEIRKRGHYHMFVTDVRQVQEWLKENRAR